MGLEAVKDEVIRQAKEQETALLAEARKEAGRIIKEAEAKAEEMKLKSESETKKIIDTLKRQATASAELESKKMLLETKKHIIENVFAEVKKKLEAMEDRKKEDYLKKLVEKAKQEINLAYVYCGKKDAKFLKGMVTEQVDIIGGVIAENKEKTIRVDYSFETFLETLKEREMQEVNKLIFGENAKATDGRA